MKKRKGLIVVLTSVIRLHGVWALSTACPETQDAGNVRFSKILDGEVAVFKDWLPKELCRRLQKDASSLFDDGLFRADGLASYVAERNFDASQDRMTMRSSAWIDTSLGDPYARDDLAQRMKALRSEVAQALQRPSMTEEQPLSHEITYSRFAPGAVLGRHTDEHHEESKGREGWMKPTRRSVSWLVYLNDDWQPSNEGALRCYELRRPVATDVESVGADRGGAVQVGWRDASGSPTRPVFLDSEQQDSDGNCALFVPSSNGGKKFISRNFFIPREPIDFAQFITDPTEASYFRRLVIPRSTKEGSVDPYETTPYLKDMFQTVDIAPEAGTLVLFDSVALLHEVLAPVGKERWAATGWFHETLPVPQL